MQVLCAQKRGHLDKFEECSSDGVFLGYSSSSWGFRVWNLETNQLMETCEVSFDETLPRSSPAFELSGNDEIGASIFEEDDAADGDERTTARAADPLASETTTDDEGRLLLTPSTTIELFPEAPAVDTGEVTSEAQASQQVQQDHPSDQIISDVGQRTLRSNTGSIVVFAHSAFVANFEPKDIEHTLSDAN